MGARLVWDKLCLISVIRLSPGRRLSIISAARSISYCTECYCHIYAVTHPGHAIDSTENILSMVTHKLVKNCFDGNLGLGLGYATARATVS